MDADVLWPKTFPFNPEFGYLYTPLRYLYSDFQGSIPKEEDWRRFPIHRNVGEWAGYSQIFYAEDPVLGQPPWHQTYWTHAGGADSFFQRKWPNNKKIRPDWRCLHLGPSGVNWCGKNKKMKLKELLYNRIKYRNSGLDMYKGEYIDVTN
jgi:hypothetical protein